MYVNMCVYRWGRGGDERQKSPKGPVPHTCILSTGSENELALWMRYVCSMYSVSRCRKLRGSLNMTGIVILDSSY